MRWQGKEFGRSVLGTVVVVALFALAVAWGTGVSAEDKAGNDEERLSIGVVDYESLRKQHRDYESLQQLDEQIRLLEEELQFLPLEDQRRVVNTSQNKMRDEVAKAQKEVQREYDSINREMAGLSASMSAQLEREGRELQEHYRHVLEERLKALVPQQDEAPADAKKQLDNYLRDMAQVREQRLVGKRLELERQMANKLEIERSRSDEILASYDNEVMKSNQEKRVNLQLQLQTVENPEEEAKIQEELRNLGDEEAAKKEAKSEELRAEFEKMATEEKQRVEQELAAYEQRMNEEAQAKFEQERNKILKGIQPVDVEANRRLAQAQIDEVRNLVNAEMKAKQDEMQATMQKRSQEARAKLEKKQADVEKRLRKLQDQLNDLVQKTYANVSDDTRKKMDDVQAKIDELKKQREDMDTAIRNDLSQIVAGVAQKQNIDTVVGSYIVNIDCIDLTDLAMVALKQAK